MNSVLTSILIMPQKIIAGNWKMNLNYAQAMTLADAIAAGITGESSCEVILAPPSIYLHDVLRRIGHHDRISVASQNCADREPGAYTGELSAMMLASVGIDYSIIGHSERRIYFGESDPLLARKVDQCFKYGILPIFCCGETLDEREQGVQSEVVERQLRQGLFHLSEAELSDCIIAYEPVWAIGTGKTATPGQAQEMHSLIRQLLRGISDSVAERVSILYGGSVTPATAQEMLASQDVDGALVGGASLKADDFLSIIQACR